MKNNKLQTISYVIIFILTLGSFFCCYAAESELGKYETCYLGLSAYIADERMSAIMGETYFQQAICLLDWETGKIVDIFEIPNGSLVVGDLSDPSIVHAINAPGYSAYHLGYVHDWTNNDHNIISLTFRDIQKWEGEYHTIHITDTVRDYMILGVKNSEIFYALQPNSYLSTDKLPLFFKREIGKTAKQYSTSFAYDPFSGWEWPTNAMAISREGKALLAFRMSMDKDIYWWLIDTETDLSLEYALSNDLHGPFCWMNENEVLAWTVDYDEFGPVRILSVLDPYTGDHSQMEINGKNIVISGGCPEPDMAINEDGTEISIWIQPLFSDSLTGEIILSRIDLETAKMTMLSFTEANIDACGDFGDTYQYTDGENTIYIQNSRTCPSLFYVYRH